MLRIRAAEEADAEAIVRLTAAGWRAAYRGIVPAARIENLPIAGWRHDVRAGLRSPNGDSFTRIAELDDETAGYCFVAAPAREEDPGSKLAEVVAIYVDPGRWRRGVGRALLDSATDEGRSLGYAEAILWSFERNAQALSFYEALGWSRDGAVRAHAATGAPTVRLRRTLGQPRR